MAISFYNEILDKEKQNLVRFDGMLGSIKSWILV